MPRIVEPITALLIGLNHHYETDRAGIQDHPPRLMRDASIHCPFESSMQFQSLAASHQAYNSVVVTRPPPIHSHHSIGTI